MMTGRWSEPAWRDAPHGRTLCAVHQLEGEFASLCQAAEAHFDAVRRLLRRGAASGLSPVEAAAAELAARLDRIERWRRAALEAALGDVERLLAASGSELAQAGWLAGDSHAGARPLLIADTNGRRYVYKAGEGFPYLLYDHWLSGTGAARPVFALRAGGVGRPATLRAFVEAQPRVDDPRRFFYEYGRLIGFAVLFGVVDLHCENVIVHDGRPVPIDLECALYPFPNLAMSFNLQCTGLIEPRQPGARRNLSALHGGGALAEWCDPYLSGAKVSVFRTVDIRENRAIGGDQEVIDASRYKQEMLAGLVELTEDAIRRKAELADWLELARPFRHRVLYSPSVLYRVLLSEGAFLGARKAAALFRRRLRYSRAAAVESDVLGSEVSQLVMGDIPIFYQRAERPARLGGADLYVQRIRILQERGARLLSAQLAALLDSYDTGRDPRP